MQNSNKFIVTDSNDNVVLRFDDMKSVQSSITKWISENPMASYKVYKLELEVEGKVDVIFRNILE